MDISAPVAFGITDGSCGLQALGQGGSRIPTPLTPLIGRQAEVDRVVALLHQDAVRLVTLTGPGGVGKTRIAIEVAQQCARQGRREAAYVSLSALRDPDRVPATIAQALGLAGHRAAPLDVISTALRNCPVLLVLDNFEQLLDAAPFIVHLLERNPLVKALVTSRSVLHVSGEHDVAIAPLELPDPSSDAVRDAGSYPAIELFVERARAANAGFAAGESNLAEIAAICRRLDGLPLAIELAAARAAYLSPEAILARLDHRLTLLTGGNRDRMPHQQTMRDTIAWSHELLSEREKEVFRRLAVFPGSFGLDAAACVAGQPQPCDGSDIAGPGDAIEMLDVLGSLVDKSLIARSSNGGGEPVFSMLQTVREFGLEELARSGEDEETRRRHSHWMARLVWQESHRFLSPEDPSWFTYLLSDVEGIRAAAEFAIASGDVRTALRITGGVWGICSFGGLLKDGRRLIEAALGQAGPGDASPELAQTLLALGMVEWIDGRTSEAEAVLRQAQALAQSLDERAMLQHILLRLSQTALYAGKLEEAADQAITAIALDVPPGPTVWTATARTQLGLIRMRRGDFDAARQLLEQAETEMQITGYRTGRLWTMQIIADLALEQGNVTEAARWHRESLPLAVGLPNAWTIYEELIAAARLADFVGTREEAETLARCAARLRRQYGVLPRNQVEWQLLEPASTAEGGPRSDDSQPELPFDRAIDLALRVVTRIAAGETAANTGAAALSSRETEVLRLLAEGHSNPAIASTLFISRKTVEHHVSAIMAKLGVTSRAGAVARAYQEGLL